ncbi:L,D-transpeptidase family protein [Brevibacillus sp. SYP-B805]|uniref:L,D-transpeptidase family protein n=1 Tax=Brevibacillus sp. SYP-B805 TaxID=1578199 RepID=UPI0013ED4A22|nr:L,D-transpeptidase family protein [Brevibacillus sp. SYP-B805]
MDKARFLQEKIAFFHRNPTQNDFAFYRYFTEQFPDEAAGWLHLGQEWERRGQLAEAREAYRRALHGKPDAFQEEAREAYHALLRKQKKETLRNRLRRRVISLALLGIFLLFPQSPVGERPTDAAAQRPQQPSAFPAAAHAYVNHTEVIAVPGALSIETTREQVKNYLLGRRPTLSQPYTLIVLPETPGIPLFTPLLFYRPAQVKGVLRYDPSTQSILSEQWYPTGCACDQVPYVNAAKTAFRAEQQRLEQVLILRNALYRHYQRTGRLPGKLADLAGAYPSNELPAIPQPATAAGSASGSSAAWSYFPEAFRPAEPWASLRDVLPLADYPEPAVPLEPLQILVNQSSYSMTLMSGPHPVRRYPIGIGKKGAATPEGYFTITRKINHPRGHDDIYGTRGMIFHTDAYAIHGTNNPQSIGKQVSLGCIRLHNADVEELYSFVTPGTEVIISAKPAPVSNWSNPFRYTLPAGREEETPFVTYRWLH